VVELDHYGHLLLFPEERQLRLRVLDPIRFGELLAVKELTESRFGCAVSGAWLHAPHSAVSPRARVTRIVSILQLFSVRDVIPAQLACGR
jgi:hypothetical protein